MPMLDGVEHEIPTTEICEDCHKIIHIIYLQEFTVVGKFIAFHSYCITCNTYKWYFAGLELYINAFNKFFGDLQTPQPKALEIWDKFILGLGDKKPTINKFDEDCFLNA